MCLWKCKDRSVRLHLSQTLKLVERWYDDVFQSIFILQEEQSKKHCNSKNVYFFVVLG